MAKRKGTTPATGAGRRSKRTKTAPAPTFVWKSREWKEKVHCNDDVSILEKISNRKQKVVTKVLLVTEDDDLPREVSIMLMVPGCNRIVTPIHYTWDDPDEYHGTAFYEYYPLGDLAQWKEDFNDRNYKPVPESFIWRFFFQMAQALALLQAQIGPNLEECEILLHRDIKPMNFLVVENPSSTYPSFKLHDFGCATVYRKSEARDSAIVGTFEYQPPEIGKVNTKAAEIWALGACVHFLATGIYPTEDKYEFGEAYVDEHGQDPDEAVDYGGAGRWYAAHVPRQVTPINLSPGQQRQQGLGPFLSHGGERFVHQYSDELNSWMKRCLSFTPGGRPTAIRLVNEMGTVAKKMLYKMGGKAALVDLETEYDVAA
ncbi:hypothetical protein HBH56_146320 [Parastagonospora nodorum]|uniref:non-specific serine/threonine protein kinase n=2 Tax=Phaeosphaeria nodorum (strain SN15 / ATCC MYA-4574 / FGSC 10173) TaxID=321614 RepID=A0A7U2I2V2_PHANO|nr:hypothetical protein SNOG_11946 [Parastagonospora nodorum SN15]KAH3910790.1 hypothetical protein HBH56_146320 [Parastagonospora nodorum]EAT80358.1 hypothetical protein SNOG_11946 [Parastagonospora nodorum SN15]KAH3927710.1 hypothetical protein HBH54_151510 [Parastagonospora nodorum]KAH3947910.1 hypothetical protein HBH53_111530 [Parastagonospora nodorum]KAH3971038.1 hypothetical protein HBH52_159980 [Parastagonospora nodorum]